MRADNSRHLAIAAQQRAAHTRRRAVTAIRRLAESDEAVTFEAVAKAAGVSRSWLYTQDDLRADVDRLRAQRRPSTAANTPPPRQRASEQSLIRRLQAATDKIRRLEQANHDLNDALARALGEQRARSITTGQPATRPTDT